MKAKSIPSQWIYEEGLRLDCGPYILGALESKKLLENLPNTQKLREITLGGEKGIFHAGRKSRTWVDSLNKGIPFLGSTDILAADLSYLPLISKKQIKSSPEFLIHEGWTLITRSGTIGRMAFARQEMDGMACSEHVMRVIPDSTHIYPGYLYAYLSSRFGVPLVVSSTYGSIIQSIEPHHLKDLPVPRFGKDFEQKIHSLVTKSSLLRTTAYKTIRSEVEKFDSIIKDIDLKSESPRINYVNSLLIQERFDAQYYDPVVAEVRGKIVEQGHSSISDFCSRIFLPGIFKRIQAEDTKFGAPYFTGASLFWLEPIPKGILSRSTSLFDQVLLEKGTILVQAFGQDGGLTGRSIWVGNHLHGCTTTHMLVRLNAKDPKLAGYLFAFLQSEAGYRQIACLTYGGSIPHLDENGIASVVIPLMPDDEMRQISKTVINALDDRDEALSLELEARKLVEQAIEEAA
jgi:type I restriction enzyme S subunit